MIKINKKYFVDLTPKGIEFLKERRKLLFNSQRNVSKVVGINQSVISDWERKKYKPTLSVFRGYLDVLNIDSLKFLDNPIFSKIIYFSPYKKDLAKIKRIIKYKHQTLEKRLILTEKIRKIIKKKRKEMFGSQQNAAKACNLDQSSISYWENGKINPTLERFKNYLKMLELSYIRFKNKNYFIVEKEKIVNKMVRAGAKANEKSIRKQKRLTKEKAFILGVLGPGDGYVGIEELQLGVTDKEFADEFERCIKKVYGLAPSRYIRKEI